MLYSDKTKELLHVLGEKHSKDLILETVIETDFEKTQKQDGDLTDLLEMMRKDSKNCIYGVVVDTDFKKALKQELNVFDFLEELHPVFTKYEIVAIEGGVIAYNKTVDKIGIKNALIITEGKCDFLEELRSIFNKYGIIAIEGGVIAYNKAVDKIGIKNCHIITVADNVYFGKPLFVIDL